LIVKEGEPERQFFIYGLPRLVITDEVTLNTILVLACMPTAVTVVITPRIIPIVQNLMRGE